MDRALLEQTVTFLNYGLDDVLVLRQIFQRFLELINAMLKESLKLPTKYLFTEENLPLTTGALVARIFENYIYYYGQTNSQRLYYNLKRQRESGEIDEKGLGPNSAFKLALWAISFVKKTHSKRDEYFSVFKDFYSEKNLKSVLEKSFIHSETLLKWDSSPPFDSLPYSGASREVLAQNDSRTTSLLNCLVSGGRANNEMPWEYKIDNVLDIDLVSCYGSALCSFDYPIGLPTIVAFGPNEQRMTFKEFLQKHSHELIPGLSKITVSGKLTFEQDLVFSKVTTYEKMKLTLANYSKKFETHGEEVVHFANDFVQARCECQNAVITSDILDFLKKVATHNEYKEFMNLQVETALFWKQSDRRISCEDWINRVLENPGEFTFNESTQGVDDSRSRSWFSIPLNEFIGKLVKKRNALKAESKRATDPSERQRLKGLQNILKLIINTLYGCLASPYFSIGNVVLADNITARARVNVWLMCKALNLRQSITDGGIYSPVGVNFFREGKSVKKPGFDTLSDIRRLQEHRSIVVKPLGGLDWSSLFESGRIIDYFTSLDNLAYEHVNTFWSEYDVRLMLNVEHKLENTAIHGIYLNKANYGLKTLNPVTGVYDREVLKLRGARMDEGDYEPIVYSLFKQLINNNDHVKLETCYKTRKLLKLGSWRRYLECDPRGSHQLRENS